MRAARSRRLSLVPGLSKCGLCLLVALILIMIYIGAKQHAIPRERLKSIPTRGRGMSVSERWINIQHGYLAEQMLYVLRSVGLSVAKDRWCTNPNGDVLYGSVDLTDKVDDTVVHSICITNSNNGWYPIQLISGAKFLPTQCGFASGDVPMIEHHSRNMRLLDVLFDGFEKYIKRMHETNDIVDRLRHSPLTEAQSSHIILDAHRYNLCAFSLLEQVEILYRQPTHGELDNLNMWSLYHAFSETAKGMTAPSQLKLLQGVRDLFIQRRDPL